MHSRDDFRKPCCRFPFTARCGLLLTLLAGSLGSKAAQPDVLYSFQRGPRDPSRLVQGSDGTYYGTIREGGVSGNGAVFQVTSSGIISTLVSFTGANGANPLGGVTFGQDGKLYGT